MRYPFTPPVRVPLPAFGIGFLSFLFFFFVALCRYHIHTVSRGTWSYHLETTTTTPSQFGVPTPKLSKNATASQTQPPIVVLIPCQVFKFQQGSFTHPSTRGVFGRSKSLPSSVALIFMLCEMLFLASWRERCPLPGPLCNKAWGMARKIETRGRNLSFLSQTYDVHVYL